MTIRSLLFVFFAGFSATAQTAGDPGLEKWFEGFLPKETIAADTCITKLSFPPVTYGDSTASHQLLVHYVQAGRELVKPYPVYSTFSTGSDSWGNEVRVAYESYRSDAAYQSRSCETARSLRSRVGRVFRGIIPTVQATAASR